MTTRKRTRGVMTPAGTAKMTTVRSAKNGGTTTAMTTTTIGKRTRGTAKMTTARSGKSGGTTTAMTTTIGKRTRGVMTMTTVRSGKSGGTTTAMTKMTTMIEAIIGARGGGRLNDDHHGGGRDRQRSYSTDCRYGRRLQLPLTLFEGVFQCFTCGSV